MARQYTEPELREKYESIAPIYDRVDAIVERLGVRRMRRRLLANARGDVLEVAIGTGANLEHYPPDCRITAIDLSPAMLREARAKAERLGSVVDFREMSAERLAFPDASFDTVVSTLSTCTFPNPTVALREMARVCAPGGQILLLEHGRSSVRIIGRLQDGTAPGHAERTGCHWNREPLDHVCEAGLQVVEARSSFFGVFHTIRAVARGVDTADGSSIGVESESRHNERNA